MLLTGRFGSPTVTSSLLIGMLAATLSSVLESLGDYYATARVCGQPPPPKHAINRGIAMEGLGCLLSGLFGAAHGTTSYSQVVGFVAYMGVGIFLYYNSGKRNVNLMIY